MEFELTVTDTHTRERSVELKKEQLLLMLQTCFPGVFPEEPEVHFEEESVHVVWKSIRVQSSSGVLSPEGNPDESPLADLFEKFGDQANS